MAAAIYPKLDFYRRIVQAKLYIDNHYGRQIDLFAIADEAYYSKFHFARKFKEVYQRTPHQYLIFVRMEQAKMLLAKGVPLSEVSTSVGFEELSSFSKSFKRYAGINPSIYQQECLDRHKVTITSPLSLVPHCFAFQYNWVSKEQV